MFIEKNMKDRNKPARRYNLGKRKRNEIWYSGIILSMFYKKAGVHILSFSDLGLCDVTIFLNIKYICTIYHSGPTLQ